MSSTGRILSVGSLKTYFYATEGVVRAVDDVGFEINENESVGLVGESGCGKSTVALSIMRLVPPPGKIVHGNMIWRGRNLLELSEKEMDSIRGRDMSMIFQDPMTFLNPVMKIGDQIAEAIVLHQNISRQQVRSRVIETLEKVSIPSPEKVADYYPHQLSGGMRQRVLVSMAYSCNPSLLIADEPTSLLDVTIQAQVIQLIRELRDREKTALLLITHDLGVVAELCDRVYVMYAGKIVEFTDGVRIFESPKHPYTQGLLNSVLTIDQFKPDFSFIPGDVPDLAAVPTGCRFRPRCPQATKACERDPRLLEVTPNHKTACWMYD